MTFAQRNDAMGVLRRQGWTLRAIGDLFDLSPCTVKMYATGERYRPTRTISREKYQAGLHRGAAEWRCLMCDSNDYGYSTRALVCGSCSRLRRATNTGAKTAHRAVNKAIRLGALRPASEFKCADCDRQASVYDHRDYAKPLDVVPVCRPCNVRRGPGKWLQLLPVRELQRMQATA